MDKIGFVSVWEKFPINYTHIHTGYPSNATLDHFMVDKELLKYISDAGALHLGDNLSRQSTIIIKLNVGDIPIP